MKIDLDDTDSSDGKEGSQVAAIAAAAEKYKDLAVEDMVQLEELNEMSMVTNLKNRYEKQSIYTFVGSILVSVNPYKMFNNYGLDMVKKYEGQILGTLPPHLFAIASAAYSKMRKDCENQVVIICGESGAGKTEATKLIMQYLAAVNKSPSNIITEQILEATPLLESFGNAKTARNNNSSRFGKYLEIHFKDGVITGAKTTEYLLEKSRIVTQSQGERNYHVFYELLAGLTDQEKQKYGLQTADKYFYLNQGNASHIEGKDDAQDLRYLIAAQQVLGFTNEEQDIIFRILASVLHLGNVYFHRKPFAHGQEGVEIGSDAEVRWVSHLLQLNVEGIFRALTIRTTEARKEKLFTPLNIDQALDARDAIAKALYSSLFSWLVQRVNLIDDRRQKRKTTLAILDIYGFEDLQENSFEQLCINFANETLQSHFNKYVFKLEQQEYAKEQIRWEPLPYPDNINVINLIAKKPIGILPLLDDESNFPKANDQSFLDKCHYNHAPNELYSRPRMSSAEFGVRHFAGQIWYQVDGFLEKNRDILRFDVIDLLISSKMSIISKMFVQLRNLYESPKTLNRSDGRFITMKPRAPTVAARFQDSLHNLFELMSRSNPWFIRCLKPNNDKAPLAFNTLVVLDQLRYSGMLETIKIRKTGYPIRVPFEHFIDRYRCLLEEQAPRGFSPKHISNLIASKVCITPDQFQIGVHKIFLRESLVQVLEKGRVAALRKAVITIQKYTRGYLARRRYHKMMTGIVKIQAAYRGYRQRRNYLKLRRGVVRLQATLKMKRQRQEYLKMKALMEQKRQAERMAAERRKQRIQQQNLRAQGVNHLEIPAELAFVFTKLDDWQCIHSDRALTSLNQDIISAAVRVGLPRDIDVHAFTKFTNIYFRAHIWGMKREPIKTPFLTKNNDTDFDESLAVFKLILRFMNDHNLTGKKEKVLADYIAQKGLQNSHLRDEIFAQLCNQTHENDNLASLERGWQLMSHVLSSFTPSSMLFKYLLKYVSDEAFDGYKSVCQQKLLQSERIEPQNVRTYPPTFLEFRAIQKRLSMALEAFFADGDARIGEVHSWMTGQEFAFRLLKARGVEDAFGWTVDLEDDGDTYGLNGNDYVLDLISEMEIPPAFPVCKSYFLCSPNPRKGFVDHNKIRSPHNASQINKMNVDFEDTASSIPSYQESNSRPRDSHYPRPQHMPPRSLSRDQINAMERHKPLMPSSSYDPRYIGAQDDRESSTMSLTRDFGLSKRSRLNERYLNALRADPIARSVEDIKLAEASKLNRRYASKPQLNQPRSSPLSKVSQSLSKRSISMQELGLASSALNERYFNPMQKTTSESQNLAGNQARMGPSPSHRGYAGRKEENMRETSVNNMNRQYESRNSPAHQNNRINGNSMHSASSSASSTLSSDDEAEDGDDYHEVGRRGSIENDHHEMGHQPDAVDLDDQGVDPTQELNSKYIKYGTSGSGRFRDHSTKGYLESRTSLRTESDYIRSSALSDTSEAPSLASHVKNIKIPQHSSELDQYLDDLFNPVLDGNLDELSDARSLAASIKGGPEDYEEFVEQILGGVEHRELDALSKSSLLSKALKGGGENGIETSAPEGRCSSSSNINNGGEQDESGMNFMNIAGMTVPMSANASEIVQRQVLQQQMMQMQQRAFLASAVQQNLQIQQQLLEQNQALQQLLETSVSPAQETSPLPISPAFDAPTPPVTTSPFPNVLTKPQKSESQVPSSFGKMIPPPPPPPPPPAPPSPSLIQDVYGRAKTVRIGKWRWPPPKDENSAEVPATSFLEFKIKKHLEKASHKEDVNHSNVSQTTSTNLQNSAASQSLNPPLVPLAPYESKDQIDSAPQPPARAPESKSKDQKSKLNDIQVKIQAKAAQGSVGKLQISSEMKAKLEQLTIDQSVRSTKKEERVSVQSRSMEDISDEAAQAGVKKLCQQRKALLEQQLSGLVGFAPSQNIPPPPPPNKLERRFESEGDLQSKMAQANTPPTNHRTSVTSLVEKPVHDEEESHFKRGHPLSKSRSGGSRELRERKDELGPHSRMHTGTICSTVVAEYGDGMSQAATTANSLIDAMSTRNSFAYEGSINSSIGRSVASQKVRRMSVPPPPPPTRSHPSEDNQSYSPHHRGPPSVAPSSTFYAPNSPLLVKRKDKVPPPIAPRISQERFSSEGHSEIPNSEFLDHMTIGDEESSQIMMPSSRPVCDSIGQPPVPKTKLFPPNFGPYLTYNRVPWKLRIRKEIFSPNEKLDDPLMVHLMFAQIVSDAFADGCIRLNGEERRKLRAKLVNSGITLDNVNSSSHRMPLKRNVIEWAKKLPTYFCRLYPVSGGRNLPNVHMLGVSHSAVRLVSRERDAAYDYLRVLDTLSFEDIGQVMVPRKNTLQIILKAGGWISLFSPRANQIRNLIEKFAREAREGDYELCRAITDYRSDDPAQICFNKGDIIKVVRRPNHRVPKGWVHGITSTGHEGRFPCDLVVPLTRTEIKQLQQYKQDKMSATPETNGISMNGSLLNGHGGPENGSRISPGRRKMDGSTEPNSWVESKLENGDEAKSDVTEGSSQAHDGKFSLLQFALFNFKEAIEKYDLRTKEGSLRGTLNLIESLKKKKKGKKSKNGQNWTWSELAEMIKFTPNAPTSSLLKLPSDLSKLSIECFYAIMRYMGDQPMKKNQTEVDCVYTILVNCHKYAPLRDEVFCQLMKQTTSNKSSKPDSCQRGWRLFSMVCSYFDCSDLLRPYLFKYLETAAYDKRRAYHGMALVCLQNLRKTFKYGGRKNVPSIEEIAAIGVGRNSKRQIYRLPGGAERVINTKSSTVVQDIVSEISSMLGVGNHVEQDEFSLYCIVEGDPYTMPLNKDEYILDITTELLKNGCVFYLIFCRSVWLHPLRLENSMYIDVVFNQVAPDYLEGLLLVTPQERLTDDVVEDIARIAALLHRAADMEEQPTKDEVKYLLPKPVLPMKEVRPPQWVSMVQSNWPEMAALSTIEAKAQCLDILQKWPLFGSCFFAVKRIQTDSPIQSDHILALNKDGIHFLDIITHETMWRHPFDEVISTRKVRAEDGTLFLDLKCGDLMQQKITRIQTDQAHEISRLIRQYIEIEQGMQTGGSHRDAPRDVTLSRNHHQQQSADNSASSHL